MDDARIVVFALLQCHMRARYWSEVLARMIRTPNAWSEADPGAYKGRVLTSDEDMGHWGIWGRDSS